MSRGLKIYDFIGGKKKNYYLLSFFVAFAAACLVFLPFMIMENGYFLYYGDFNVQQVPFYQMVHDAIREGNFMWSFTTDLGANTIASYSFYLLGSPFFWLTLPFSSDMVPHLMGPLLILKFSFASLGAYTYLKRYVINQNYAVLGGLLYAFSGFSVYNVFFNHFHEAIIIFPFLLAAIDKFIIEKKRGLVFITVLLSCLMNYYFFVGQFVFCIIYWVLKTYYGRYKFRIKEFLFLLLEGLLGVLATAFILLPTILCILDNPRLDNFPFGWSTLLYGNEQRYVHILQSLFFPPDIPARPNFTPDSNAKWASLGAWLPVVSMTGVIAYIKSNKNKWLKTMLISLFVIALVPILNSMFQGFNMSYYARWYYMLVMMMILATVKAIESNKTKWRVSFKITFAITFIMSLLIGLMPIKKKVDGQEEISIGLMTYPDRFWLYVAIALGCLLIFAIIICLKNKNKKKFISWMFISIFSVSVIYSLFILGMGKTQSYSTKDFIIPHLLQNQEEIELPDQDISRIDVYDGMDNIAMYFNTPSIQAFHSVVPGSIMEFYPTVGVKRDVASRPEVEQYGLRGLLSVKWMISYKKDSRDVLPGFKYYGIQNGFDVYENKYYVPIGFGYNEYITREQYDSCKEEDRHLLLMKAMVLDEETIQRNSDILSPGNLKDYSYTEEAYFADCRERQLETCDNFSRDNTGFSAEYTAAEKDELVFFSVPYEKGFKAYVNGEEAVIEKVNIGFMAVRVPANTTSTIRFEYFTPGLTTGLIISAGAVVVFVLYCLFTGVFNKSKGRKRVFKRKKEN
ncbi:MAG: YfhO family protein [Clostridia bacterium]|nr:YfhO family protein [Clostridia bacterium]